MTRDKAREKRATHAEPSLDSLLYSTVLVRNTLNPHLKL